jgi:hypothetical protein
MKSSLFLLAALSATVVAQDDIIPTAYSKDRYAEMSKSSPFVLATPPAETAPTKVDPFANIYLRAYGSDFVVIQRVGDDHTIRIIGDQPSEEGGFKVEKINWSTIPGGSTVDLISKSGERGTVKFDENLTHQVVQQPQAPGGPNAMRRPMGGPQGVAVPPGVNVAVPRPPTTAGSPISQIPRPTMQPQPQGGQRQGYGGRGPGGQGAPGAATQGAPQGGFRGNSGGSDGGRQRIRSIQNGAGR